MSEKRKQGFNIISNTSTTHGRYHTGTLNLSNMSSILIDDEEARIDLGLLHAKSRVERGIKFSPNPDDVEGGKMYWVVWVTVDQNENGPYYAGMAACPMRINHETRKGWKNLAEHVNRMDDALKRRIKLDGLGEKEKRLLKECLIRHNEKMWENSSGELKEHFS